MADVVQGFGPSNPRPWNPNDPILRSPLAPHETRATLRMHRAGYPGPEIAKALKMKGTQLMDNLQRGLDEEQDAHRTNRPIHDATIPRVGPA